MYKYYILTNNKIVTTVVGPCEESDNISDFPTELAYEYIHAYIAGSLEEALEGLTIDSNVELYSVNYDTKGNVDRLVKLQDVEKREQFIRCNECFLGKDVLRRLSQGVEDEKYLQSVKGTQVATKVLNAPPMEPVSSLVLYKYYLLLNEQDFVTVVIGPCKRDEVVPSIELTDFEFTNSYECESTNLKNILADHNVSTNAKMYTPEFDSEGHLLNVVEVGSDSVKDTATLSENVSNKSKHLLGQIIRDYAHLHRITTSIPVQKPAPQFTAQILHLLDVMQPYIHFLESVRSLYNRIRNTPMCDVNKDLEWWKVTVAGTLNVSIWKWVNYLNLDDEVVYKLIPEMRELMLTNEVDGQLAVFTTTDTTKFLDWRRQVTEYLKLVAYIGELEFSEGTMDELSEELELSTTLEKESLIEYYYGCDDKGRRDIIYTCCSVLGREL